MMFVSSPTPVDHAGGDGGDLLADACAHRAHRHLLREVEHHGAGGLTAQSDDAADSIHLFAFTREDDPFAHRSHGTHGMEGVYRRLDERVDVIDIDTAAHGPSRMVVPKGTP